MKSMIKKITVCLFLFGLCAGLFAQSKGIAGRDFKGKVDGESAEVLFLEDNFCLLIATAGGEEDYMGCVYYYIPQKHLGFLWEDKDSFMDFDDDYIVFKIDESKGILTLSADGDTIRLSEVR